ncbi:MAG: hypothetical protein EBR82_45905 [Caulobacteraceae bacterium]|nr:hypothetical protein [Caulobacteraceae bacterium]
MKLISHRGNLNGKFLKSENLPEQIDYCISIGFDVEIDIRLIENKFYLGHDEPQYKIDYEWIKKRQDKLWVHCKDLNSLFKLNEYQNDINYFWHQEDDCTLTSKNFIWTYPGKDLDKNSIAVLPELYYNIIDIKKLNCYGICSDFIGEIK